MKYLKLIFKLIVVLIIPYLFQILGFITYGVYEGIRQAANGITETEAITNTVTSKIAAATPTIIMIAALFVILVFTLVHASKKRNNITTAYRFNKMSSPHLLYSIILGSFVCFLSIGFSGLFSLGTLDPQATEMLNNLVMNNSIWVTLLSVGIIVPISEEIVFRGSVFKNLSEHFDIKWVIVIQAVIFSVYHFNLVQALPTLVIGLVIGFTVYYTNSILSGIIIHILNNSIAIILSNVLPEDLVLLPVHNIMTIIIAGIILIVTLTKLNKSKVEFQTIEQPLLEAV